MEFTSVFEGLRSVQEKWGLSSSQLAALTHVTPEKFESWLESAPHTEAQAEALVPPDAKCAVALLHVFKRVRDRYPEVDKQVEWLMSPHPDFGGNRPMDVAASSPENLLWLGYYLETSQT